MRYGLICLLLISAAGCVGRPSDEPAYYVRKMEHGVFLFEVNQSNKKSDVNSFLNSLTQMLEANQEVEVRSLVPIAAGNDSQGKTVYNVLVSTVPRRPDLTQPPVKVTPVER